MELPSHVQVRLIIEDLGRKSYAEAYGIQNARHGAILEGRSEEGDSIGRVLFVEHDPVITVTRRPGVSEHVIATPELLAMHGVSLEETDRGGDVTYHGPGQLVVYPIVDLNRLNCRIIEYLRALEEIIIGVLADLGVQSQRDEGATGVWTRDGTELAKIAAIGVRVRRWATLHGLALNVDPQLDHFGLIVPCGLHGRPVTSLRRLMGEACPSMEHVKALMAQRMGERFGAMADEASARRASAHSSPSELGGSQR